jgi:hypothetical protein
MPTRRLLEHFQFPNSGYVGCSVTCFVADENGVATASLATFYDAMTGSGTLPNPQDFDSEGKLPQLTFIEQPVVASVTLSGAPLDSIGPLAPPGGARGDYAAGGTLYLSGDFVSDGAAGTNTKDLYAAVSMFASTDWATDSIDPTKLKKVIDYVALQATVVSDADETTKGKARIGTQVEANAGLLDTVIITPLKMVTHVAAAISTAIAAALAAAKTVSGLWTFTHTKSTVQTLTDGASIAWNVVNGNAAKVTLGGNRAIAAPTNVQAGGFYALEVAQDATGSRTLTWNTVFKFGTVGTPTLTTTASKSDHFTFYSPDGTNLRCLGRSFGF